MLSNADMPQSCRQRGRASTGRARMSLPSTRTGSTTSMIRRSVSASYCVRGAVSGLGGGASEARNTAVRPLDTPWMGALTISGAGVGARPRSTWCSRIASSKCQILPGMHAIGERTRRDRAAWSRRRLECFGDLDVRDAGLRCRCGFLLHDACARHAGAAGTNRAERPSRHAHRPCGRARRWPVVIARRTPGRMSTSGRRHAPGAPARRNDAFGQRARDRSVRDALAQRGAALDDHVARHGCAIGLGQRRKHRGTLPCRVAECRRARAPAEMPAPVRHRRRRGTLPRAVRGSPSASREPI